MVGVCLCFWVWNWAPWSKCVCKHIIQSISVLPDELKGRLFFLVFSFADSKPCPSASSTMERLPSNLLQFIYRWIQIHTRFSLDSYQNTVTSHWDTALTSTSVKSIISNAAEVLIILTPSTFVCVWILSCVGWSGSHGNLGLVACLLVFAFILDGQEWLSCGRRDHEDSIG